MPADDCESPPKKMRTKEDNFDLQLSRPAPPLTVPPQCPMSETIPLNLPMKNNRCSFNPKPTLNLTHPFRDLVTCPKNNSIPFGSLQSRPSNQGFQTLRQQPNNIPSFQDIQRFFLIS